MRYDRYGRWKRPADMGTVLRRIAVVLVLLGLLGLMYLSTLAPRVERHTLTLADLPEKLNNLRIIFLSDIHQGPWYSQQQVDALVAKVNNLRGDVIILGGDYAQNSEGAVAFFRSMQPLEAHWGVYAVVGDTDRSEEPGALDALLEAMRVKHVTGLSNSVEQVRVGSDRLYIVGADDYRTGYPAVARLARQVNADDLVIFAGHSPELLPAVLDAKDEEGSANWYDLALFGHTHGGQIDLFGYTPFRRLRTELGSGYRSGWLEENSAVHLISNGVGTEILPLRLFARPQIHVITLKRGT